MIVRVSFSVQYRIKDPRAYLFNVQNPETTFRDVSEAVVRAVVGDHSVDEVVTSGRDKIAIEAQQLDPAQEMPDSKRALRLGLQRLSKQSLGAG